MRTDVWEKEKERKTKQNSKAHNIQILFGLKTERKKERCKVSNGQVEANLLFSCTTEVPYQFGKLAFQFVIT